MTRTIICHLDGRIQQVPADDPRLIERQAERERMAERQRVLMRHIANLRGIDATHDRRTYIETVERKQGEYAADRLRADFRAEWERRNA